MENPMKSKLLLILPLIFTLFLTACGGDPAPAPEDAAGSGTVSTDVTDVATDSFSQVWVDIERITAKNTDTNEVIVLTQAATQGSFDLLSLRDFSERLASKVVPDGNYGEVKVELVAGSKITIFDLLGDKKVVDLTSTTLSMDSTFDIKDGEATTLTIDFDLDSWEAALKAYDPATSGKLDVVNLPLKKAIVDKGIFVRASGVLILENSQYYLDLVAEKVKYQLAIDPNTDTTSFIVNGVYEVEGIFENNLLAIDELELQSESLTKSDDDKVIGTEGVKVYGIVEFVNKDENNISTSVQLKITKASKMLGATSVNIILDGLEDVRYENGLRSDIVSGSKLKVKGELLSASLDDLTAYTVIIKSGEIKPKEKREKFKSTEFIKCDVELLTCEIHTTSPAYGKELVIDLDRLESNSATKRCFDTGEFIGVKVEGRLSLDKTKIYVKELKSEQRCEESTTFIKGYITGYDSETSCSALDNDTAIVKLTGKMSVLSFTDATGSTVLFDDDDIVIKTRRSNGALRIKADKDADKDAIYNFLSINLDATNPGVVPVADKLYVYSDIGNVGSATVAHDAELTMVSIGGFIEISNSARETVVLEPLDRESHRKSISCSFDLQDENGIFLKSIQTNDKTKWVGNQYKFQDTRRVKAVLDENNVAQSIRFGKIESDTNNTIDELIGENISGYTDAELEEYQQRLGDALNDILQGGLDDTKFGDIEYKVEDKEEKEEEYKIKHDEEEDRLELKVFYFEDFLDEIARYSEDLYNLVDDDSRIQTKSDVINKLSEELKRLSGLIEERLESYTIDTTLTLPEEVTTLLNSIGNLDGLYDLLNAQEAFFTEDEEEEHWGEFDDDEENNDDTSQGKVSGSLFTVDNVSYQVEFPTSAMGLSGSLDFTDWELIKVVEALEDSTATRYYLEADEADDGMYARTNSFTLSGVPSAVLVDKIEVKTPELGSTIHDLTIPGTKALVTSYTFMEEEEDGEFEEEMAHRIDVVYNYGLENEVSYWYALDEGSTTIETKLSASKRNMRIYNIEPEDAEKMGDFYTDITYTNKHAKDEADKINLDLDIEGTILNLGTEDVVLRNVFEINGTATVDGISYTLTGNNNHVILERTLDDGTIDRMYTQYEPAELAFVHTLNEDGMSDTDYDGYVDTSSYVFNGVSLAHWVVDRTVDNYFVKRFGDNTAIIKMDTNAGQTVTNFYLNEIEYPLADVVFERITEQADPMFVSPYSKQKDGPVEGKFINYASKLTVALGNGRYRIITDSITPTDKTEIRNNAPVANPDAVSIDEDSSITIDVLVNDTDLDGDNLLIVDASAVFGRVFISNIMIEDPDGNLVVLTNEIIYSTLKDFNGTDTITYTISDGELKSTTSFEIVVNAVNDAPVAVDDNYAVNEDGSVQLDILANDSDPDGVLAIGNGTVGDKSNLNILADFTNGTVDDLHIYTPNLNFNGTDTATYTIADADGMISNYAIVSIVVLPMNDVPVGSIEVLGWLEPEGILTVYTDLVDADGMISEYSYAWSNGATGPTYILTSADLGTDLTVTVSYTDANGTIESVSSSPFAWPASGT